MADLSEQLVEAINRTYGVHPGHRAAHAKGVLCAGTFTAAPDAAALSRAEHFAGGPVRVHVRFSNGGGDPTVPDAQRDGRGIAVKFYLGEGRTTDVVGLSLAPFFVRTPEELIEFNEARRPDPETGQIDIAKVTAFLGTHPETVPAVTAAMTHPVPASYVTLAYHALHAFGFVDAEGSVRHGRYHFVPLAGEAALSDEDAAAASPDFLREELEERLAGGPAAFDLVVQLAGAGDPLDDPTAEWPDDRPTVSLGRLEITGLTADRDTGDDVLVFDPTRLADGLELTDDPILLARPGAYSVSVARRVAERT
jgi:catalase